MTAHDAILLLREDAIERGMSDLAIAYGWSAIRLAEERLERQAREIERARHRTTERP